MKKIFLSCLTLILIFSAQILYAEPEQDAETHKIIGGLYSLAAAIELNGKTNPDINSLVRFFERIPPGWQNEIKIERGKDKKSIWAGIAVSQYSAARRYLRANAQALGIFESPEGAAWLGGEFAWIKAAEIAKKKLKPVNFSAAEGNGTIFFSHDDNNNSWWASWPNFNSGSKKKILEAHGAEGVNVSELVAPEVKEENRTSIYDEVKPASVRVPDKMYMGTKKNSFDMSVNVGDVIFNPIPNVRR